MLSLSVPVSSQVHPCPAIPDDPPTPSALLKPPARPPLLLSQWWPCFLLLREGMKTIRRGQASHTLSLSLYHRWTVYRWAIHVPIWGQILHLCTGPHPSHPRKNTLLSLTSKILPFPLDHSHPSKCCCFSHLKKKISLPLSHFPAASGFHFPWVLLYFLQSLFPSPQPTPIRLALPLHSTAFSRSKTSPR